MNNIHDQVIRLARIDLNLFRVFATIYQEKNLTRAGEQLFLSQSAISHALARLRTHFDDPLFIRERQGVYATPLAKRIWPYVEQALKLLQQAIESSYAFDPNKDFKQLTIAMNDEIEPVLLAPIVKHFQQYNSQLCLHSVRIDRKTLAHDLATGHFDFAIDVSYPTDANTAHEPLLNDAFVVVCNQNRIKADTTLSIEDYLQAEHIAVSARPTGLAIEDYALSRHGIERRIRLRCQQYESACKLVINSQLLLTIPQSIANDLQQHYPMLILPLPIELEKIALHLYWDKTKSLEQQHAWCKAQLFLLFQNTALDLQIPEKMS